MSNGQDFEENEREREVRRKVFYLTFAALALIFGGFLIWKLSILILPIIVGSLLAFVFRPVKDRFRSRWLPHELQVLCSFAAIGLVLFFAFNTFSQTHSRRTAEVGIQGSHEIQTERKIPAVSGEIAGGKIKRGDGVT
jgi:predicted PurR-regulated permease PerM